MMIKIEFGFGVGLDKDGTRIDPSVRAAAVEVIRAEARKLFGGCTLTATTGEWFDEDTEKVYSEDGATLSILIDPGHRDYQHRTVEDRVFVLVETIKETLHQAAVYVTRYPVEVGLY